MSDSRDRWLVLIALWLVQAVVVVAVATLFLVMFADNKPAAPTPARVLEAFQDHGYLRLALMSVGGITLLQCLLLLPVHLAIPMHRRSRSVVCSLAIAGLCLGLLVVGFVAAVSEMAVFYGFPGQEGWSTTALVLGVVCSWAWFTALLIRYANRSRMTNRDLMTRVARIVFKGTVVETAALIPIDVMVRRKADCYCAAGSFLALILSGAVGFVVAGPAIFLPLFARRPHRRLAGMCAWCGYDRAGIAPSAPCPECGQPPAEVP